MAKVFWSWQSDTAQTSGRHFVKEVLISVCDELSADAEIEAADRPEVDHDTFQVSGSPAIADTILRKIRTAAVFVADVTPVAKTKGGKHVANPNVMLELGYAISNLGNERIILVMNTGEDASLKHLPFDLAHWRKPIEYSLKKECSDEQRKVAFAGLAAILRMALPPTLRTAAKEMEDQRRRGERIPDLSVSFASTNEKKLRLIFVRPQT